VDFSARNLKITWTNKVLKEKENKRKRKRGERLAERENHLIEGREREKYKGGGAFTEKLLLFSSISSLSLCLPCLVFLYIM